MGLNHGIIMFIIWWRLVIWMILWWVIIHSDSLSDSSESDSGSFNSKSYKLWSLASCWIPFFTKANCSLLVNHVSERSLQYSECYHLFVQLLEVEILRIVLLWGKSTLKKLLHNSRRLRIYTHLIYQTFFDQIESFYCLAYFHNVIDHCYAAIYTNKVFNPLFII